MHKGFVCLIRPGNLEKGDRMLNSDALRRLVAVALLVAGLVVLPSAPAVAAGDGSEEAQPAAGSEDSGIIGEVVEWLAGLLGGAEESDIRSQADPNG